MQAAVSLGNRPGRVGNLAARLDPIGFPRVLAAGRQRLVLRVGGQGQAADLGRRADHHFRERPPEDIGDGGQHDAFQFRRVLRDGERGRHPAGVLHPRAGAHGHEGAGDSPR